MGKNDAKQVLNGTVKIYVENELFLAELGHIITSGLIYGKHKIFLSDNFYFAYPSKNLKAIIGFFENDKNKTNDQLKGGIFKENFVVN